MSPRLAASLLLVASLLVSACSAVAAPPAASPSDASPSDASPSGSGSGSASGPASGSITLYTSIQQPVVDAVLAAFKAAQPGVDVAVFRAATGELSARLATELRTGGVKADVLWLTDPLSMQGWAAQGVLAAWTPAGAEALPAADRTDTSWATRVLDIVIVRAVGRTDPDDWSDLAAADGGPVALPDPTFAGSALGALGYFALEPGYGLDFYRRLKAAGAVQVQAPDDVTTGVAEGRFTAGMTLDSSAAAAAAKGSPVELVWPTDGAIAIPSPIGVVDRTDDPVAARALVEFLLSAAGQRALADAGQQPVIAGSGGPQPGGPVVSPDWSAVFGRQDELLREYAAIFGG